MELNLDENALREKAFKLTQNKFVKSIELRPIRQSHLNKRNTNKPISTKVSHRSRNSSTIPAFYKRVSGSKTAKRGACLDRKSLLI